MTPLTPEQQLALDAADGQPPRLVDPRTGTAYVLVRADFYELQRRWFDGFTRSAGWDDPALDVYEEYRDRA
jgi:hypothetical protein